MISAADKLPSVSAVKNLRRIRTFSPLRRKERKGRQKIRTCLLILCGLRVFAVKILEFGFAGFIGATKYYYFRRGSINSSALTPAWKFFKIKQSSFS